MIDFVTHTVCAFAAPAPIVAAFATVVLPLSAVGIVPPVEEAQLRKTNRQLDDHLASSAAASGDVIVLGAPQTDARNGFALVSRRDGASWTEEATLLASDGSPDDEFGHDVSISGDVVVVGAHFDDQLGPDSGSAYVYRYDGSGWVQEQKLLASDGSAADEFGESVGVSGDVAVVGAYGDDDLGLASGSAYVFRYDGTTWVQEQKLNSAGGADFDHFGDSVSVWGDVAVVGAPTEDAVAEASGAVYVYRYNGTSWMQEQRLVPSDGAYADWFGVSLRLWNDVIIVGAFDHPQASPGNGAAYIYRYDGSVWVEEQKLTASDGALKDLYGDDVSVSGDTAVVGAPWDDDTAGGSGSAYVYHYDGTSWTEVAKLHASDPHLSDYLGSSVSISGDRLVLGAPNWGGSYEGCGYVFRLTRAGEKLYAPGGAAGDQFGLAASLSGDVALVGSPLDENQKGASAGSAHLYRYDGTSWTQETTLTDYLGAAHDQFGKAVAVSGDVAVVGFPFVASDAGGVEIFRYDGTGWPLEADLCCGATGSQRGASVGVAGDLMVVGEPLATSAVGRARIYRYDGSSWGTGVQISASDAAIGDHFGSAVAVSGDVVVAGAPESNSPTNDAGAAYVYRYDGSGWVEEQKLADGSTDDQFGFSVAASGGVVVVGAPYDDTAWGTNAGTARVYRYDGSGWVLEGTLEAGEAGSYRNFGHRVAAMGDTVLVGAPNAPGGGAVYLFRYTDASTGWVLDRKLTVGDGVSGDGLGSSVAVWGDMALAGAPGDDDLGSSSGSAHLLYVPEPDPGLGLAAGLLAVALLGKCTRRRATPAVESLDAT